MLKFRLRTSERDCNARFIFLPPILASECADFDSGINEAIYDVDGQIDHDKNCGGKRYCCQHNRIISVVNAVDRKEADSGPCKHGFNNDCTAEETSEFHADHRDYRQDRVF